MWQLIVQGPSTPQRLKQPLEKGQNYLVGRASDCDITIGWEPVLSRKHFTIQSGSDGVTIQLHDDAHNPVYTKGEAVNSGLHAIEEKFVVGQTSFYVNKLNPSAGSPDAPFQELTFTQQELEHVQFADADRRLEALARLPEVIRESTSREESSAKLVSLILAGIRHADAAAVVALDDESNVETHAWERRTEVEGKFHPSIRLIKESRKGDRSVLHVWEPESKVSEQYTVAAEFDWAFSVPLQLGEREKWYIYVAGKLDSPFGEGSRFRQNIQSDVRFAQLVGEVISSSQRMNRMEGQLSVLRRFLSPPILTALEETGHDQELNIDLLKPRECNVTVLFCDLRGFSHRAEESSDDLPGLLERVNGALEVMSTEILDHGGVTGDFLGDAVLGFWGWPFSSEDAPLKACRAALSIRHAFAEIHRERGHPLQDFQVGIGIANGRAVAGQIGTSGRMAVTVFGPVVNLASRLEGMTKKLRVPIVMDEQTSQLARNGLSPKEGRVRTLAKVLPYGMEIPLTVSELIPPYGANSELSNDQIQTYEDGVEHFVHGRWEDAYRSLHSMPSSDQAQDFLLAVITQSNRRAPVNWQGIVELPSK